MQKARQTIKKDSKDYGTPEFHKQQVVERVEIEPNHRVAFNRTTCPIEYYHNRGLIKSHQYDAANTLYSLWYYGAEKSGYVTVRDPRQPRGEPNYEAREQMEEKYNIAMKELPVVTRLIVYNVVCIGEWAKYIDVAVGKKRRNTLLQDGLNRLAKHFKIPEQK